MQTQIIKLEAWKTNIKDSLKKLGLKTYKKNSEVTVIIKENPNMLNIDDLKEKSDRQKSVSISEMEKSQIKKINTERGSDDESESSNESLEIRVSNTDILPNILISSHKKNNNAKDRRASLDEKIINGINLERTKKNKDEQKKKKLEMQPLDQIEENIYKISVNQVQNERSQDIFNPFNLLGSPTSKISKLQKVPEIQVQQNDSMQEITLTEQDQSLPDSLFVLENKLNDALQFINKNRLFELQEFLYEFKAKYSNMNDRVQIKWRLLMAYCKENRKQYERASILYSQVLQLALNSPKSLTIDKADINHRLGICYMEIKKWNDGIMALVQALNEYKSKKKIIKYGECINNLGTLYLYAGIIDQAEKCFLMSYQIKKKNYPQYSRKLISSLLNLYQCNMATLNYEQASEMLALVQNIVKNLPQNQIIKGGLLRRKGKLAFLIGHLQKAEQYYLDGIHLLQQKYPFCLDYGELMNNYAMLKIDLGKFQEAKNYFNKALIILNFYFTRDSSYVQAIKKNLELVNRLISEKSNSEIPEQK